MASVYENRIESVRDKLDDWGVDALLVNSDTNRRWLSGFTGSSGILLISEDIATIGTDARYWERAREEAPDFSLDQLKGGMKESLIGFLLRDGITKIGIEPEHVTLAQLDQFKSASSKEFVEVKDAVNPMREIKTAEEVEQIKAATEITDLAMSQVGDLVEP